MTSLLREYLSVTTSIGVGQNLFDAATGDGIVEKIVVALSFEKISFNNSIVNGKLG